MTDTRYFLVRLEADLPTYRANGLMHAIKLHPGVTFVVDADYAGMPAEWRKGLEPQPAEPKKRRGGRLVSGRGSA